jgi:hypothetical protein
MRFTKTTSIRWESRVRKHEIDWVVLKNHLITITRELIMVLSRYIIALQFYLSTIDNLHVRLIFYFGQKKSKFPKRTY